MKTSDQRLASKDFFLKSTQKPFFYFISLLSLVSCLLSPPAFAGDDWLEGANGYARGAEQAKLAGKPIILYFYTEWCPYCRKFENNTLASAEVVKALSRFVRVRINPENGSRENKLAEQFGVQGYPSVYFENLASGQGAQKMSNILKSAKDFANDANQFAETVKKVPAAEKQAVTPLAVVSALPQDVSKLQAVTSTHKLYLKNGKTLEGNLVAEDTKGLMLATTDLGEVYFSQSEIQKIEKINS